MLYIALAITSLLTLFYGIAYNEQLHKTSVYRNKVDLVTVRQQDSEGET